MLKIHQGSWCPLSKFTMTSFLLSTKSPHLSTVIHYLYIDTFYPFPFSNYCSLFSASFFVLLPLKTYLTISFLLVYFVLMYTLHILATEGDFKNFSKWDLGGAGQQWAKE